MNFTFHGSANSVFVANIKKIKIVFVLERIKPEGEGMWLPVCSLVSEVNYHVVLIENGSFFRCHSNGSLVARSSVCLLFP